MKKQEDKISVIVPIYNCERFLRKCIESILDQTYENLEIVLVDDGSKDNSLQICKEFAEKDKRIKVISQENGGSAKARNAGLDSGITGKYICFIDSDDYISNCFFETLHTAITDYDADLAVTLDTRVNEKQKLKFTHKFDKDNYPVVLFDKTTAMSQLFSGKKFGVGQCNKMFRADLMNKAPKIRFPNDILCSEDIPFVYENFERAEKVVLVPVKNYAYTKRNGSKVRSKFNPKKLTTFKGLNYCAESCMQNVPGAYPYVAGWRVLSNFEMLFYMFRDGYFDYENYVTMCDIMKKEMPHLSQSPRFPLYRRTLVPFGTFLLTNLYKMKFRKEFKQIKKDISK